MNAPTLALRPRVYDTADVDLLLRVIAGTGLRTDAPTQRVALAGRRADVLLERVTRERLTGHLVAALRDGRLQAPTPVHDAATAAHRRMTWRVLQLEQVLLRVVDLLAAAGIDIRVLKGPALARTIYRDPAMRTFVDVDVLVPSRDVERATAVLASAGHQRRLPELRPGFDARFAKSVTFVDPSGCEVDLHRSLVVGPFGLLIPTDQLFVPPATAEVARRRLPTLPMVEQMLHVCYHAALGDVPPRLASLRDVAEVLSRDMVELDPLLTTAERWEGQAVVARAVVLASQAFGLPGSAIVDWAHEHRPTRREARLLAGYVSAHRSNSRKYLQSVAVISGVRHKAAYLTALLCPARRFLAQRGRRRVGWLLHGGLSLLRATRALHRRRLSR